MLHSHACREKCLRSEEHVFPAADWMGGATVDAREPTTGRAMEAMAADGPEQSPPSPNRCWMEWSWKQGSDSRTEAARDILGGGTERHCWTFCRTFMKHLVYKV